MGLLRRGRHETYEEMRARIIRETELSLFIGMRYSERSPRIPAREVGKGGFARDFADAFWQETLGDMTHLVRLVGRNPHLFGKATGRRLKLDSEDDDTRRDFA